jgi:hypothetical protein
MKDDSVHDGDIHKGSHQSQKTPSSKRRSASLPQKFVLDEEGSLQSSSSGSSDNDTSGRVGSVMKRRSNTSHHPPPSASTPLSSMLKTGRSMASLLDSLQGQTPTMLPPSATKSIASPQKLFIDEIDLFESDSDSGRDDNRDFLSAKRPQGRLEKAYVYDTGAKSHESGMKTDKTIQRKSGNAKGNLSSRHGQSPTSRRDSLQRARLMKSSATGLKKTKSSPQLPQPIMTLGNRNIHLSFSNRYNPQQGGRPSITPSTST